MSASPTPSRGFALRAFTLGLFACLSAGPALAASLPPGDVGALLACRKVAAQAARLQCFDSAAAVVARAMTSADTSTKALPPSAPAAATRPAATEPNAQQTFGLSAESILAREVASGRRRKSISGITARVTDLHAAADGRMIYELDDGQTWEELQANGYAPELKAGDRVQISRGWLDSYWLQAPSGRGCKVQRLR
jgi:hypothetical protein